MRTPSHIRVVAPNQDAQDFLPLSDVHFGSPTQDYDKAIAFRDRALERGALVLCLGDMMENATRYSVGSGVYEQLIPPQQQQDMTVEYLRPLKEAGLLIGMVIGNHEWRSANEVGVDLTKNVCDILDVPYLGFSIYVDIVMRNEIYQVFGTHGAGGGSTLTGKSNAIQKLGQHRHGVDIFTMGHVHELWHGSDVIERYNRLRKTVEERKRHYVLTGAYLKYKDSYGEMKSYPPSKTGTAWIKLYGDSYHVKVDTSGEIRQDD